MANIKSQTKRIEISARNKERNKAHESELKTAIKKVEAFVKAGKKEEANSALKEAISLLDRNAQRGVITVNSANRKKAHLTKIVNELQ